MRVVDFGVMELAGVVKFDVGLIFSSDCIVFVVTGNASICVMRQDRQECLLCIEHWVPARRLFAIVVRWCGECVSSPEMISEWISSWVCVYRFDEVSNRHAVGLSPAYG